MIIDEVVDALIVSRYEKYAEKRVLAHAANILIAKKIDARLLMRLLQEVDADLIVRLAAEASRKDLRRLAVQADNVRPW